MSTQRATWQRHLSERDMAIVSMVGSYRVMTGSQVRRLYFSIGDGGTELGTLRRSQRVLKRLVDLKVLDTLERRIGGVRAGSAGYCYVLGYRGQRLLYPNKRARSGTSIGDRFVAHALDVVEIAVELHEAKRSRHTHKPVELIDIQPEPDCWRDYLASSGSVEILKPDLFVAVGVGEFEHRWFIEVDRATESLTRVDHKCRHYLRYLQTGHEQSLHGVFPKVLWTVPSPKRRKQLLGVFARLPPPSEQLFAVTLHDNTIEHLRGEQL